MAFSRRLHKELEELISAGLPYFTDINVEESNILAWEGLIVPNSEPYNKGAFRIQINFSPDYPFKPPQVKFKTKIYHPNIGEDGQVCLPLLQPDNWKPATRVDQIVEALVATVNNPQPDHSLRQDLAEEYTKNKKKFFMLAKEFTVKHAEPRP